MMTATMMAALVVAVVTSSMVAAMSRLSGQRHRERADHRRNEN
jgi:hypothetical protein